jgi:hypothetical protein
MIWLSNHMTIYIPSSLLFRPFGLLAPQVFNDLAVQSFDWRDDGMYIVK